MEHVPDLSNSTYVRIGVPALALALIGFVGAEVYLIHKGEYANAIACAGASIIPFVCLAVGTAGLSGRLKGADGSPLPPRTCKGVFLVGFLFFAAAAFLLVAEGIRPGSAMRCLDVAERVVAHFS